MAPRCRLTIMETLHLMRSPPRHHGGKSPTACSRECAAMLLLCARLFAVLNLQTPSEEADRPFVFLVETGPEHAVAEASRGPTVLTKTTRRRCP